MKFTILTLCLVTAYASVIDVFEATNGHEPRVAINCDHVPFYIDLQTGAWVEDSEGLELCDHNKEVVKKYCQKMYPKLNITNIVEANTPQKFNNWCRSGESQCTQAKEVVPYRCLVNEYEADALMVPEGCKFDHIHNPNMCLSHDEWAGVAKEHCKKTYSMELKNYGILLSCGTDKFTGVEFVCCSKKAPKPTVEEKPVFTKDVFHAAIAKFLKYLPNVTKGCDRSTYLNKQTTMEEHHRSQIAAVVDEWDEAEKRYNELKAKAPVAAEEKMKRTLEVFRQTLAALEQESKDEKERLRIEHADCINTQISKNKRDSMNNYLAAIQKDPVDAEEILKTIRKFIQVCEHDRVHSLRHFEHIRKRDPTKADTIRGELLQHLKNLNKVVNESMSLLNYLPEIAQKFGLTGTAILKPKLTMPKIKKEDHTHERIEEILRKNKHLELTDKDDEESIFVTSKPVPSKKSGFFLDGEDDDEDDEDEIYEAKSKNVPVLTRRVAVPLTKSLGKVQAEEGNDRSYEEMDDIEDEHHHKKSHRRSPMVINIILGLCCGILVVMLVVVVVMVVQRRRVARTRVVIAENNDEREHLVQMQKSGFENPTYKFFYY